MREGVIVVVAAVRMGGSVEQAAGDSSHRLRRCLKEKLRKRSTDKPVTFKTVHLDEHVENGRVVRKWMYVDSCPVGERRQDGAGTGDDTEETSIGVRKSVREKNENGHSRSPEARNRKQKRVQQMEQQEIEDECRRRDSAQRPSQEEQPAVERRMPDVWKKTVVVTGPRADAGPPPPPLPLATARRNDAICRQIKAAMQLPDTVTQARVCCDQRLRGQPMCAVACRGGARVGGASLTATERRIAAMAVASPAWTEQYFSARSAHKSTRKQSAAMHATQASHHENNAPPPQPRPHDGRLTAAQMDVVFRMMADLNASGVLAQRVDEVNSVGGVPSCYSLGGGESEAKSAEWRALSSEARGDPAVARRVGAATDALNAACHSLNTYMRISGAPTGCEPHLAALEKMKKTLEKF